MSTRHEKHVVEAIKLQIDSHGKYQLDYVSAPGDGVRRYVWSDKVCLGIAESERYIVYARQALKAGKVDVKV